jgi:hypothetical protein
MAWSEIEISDFLQTCLNSLELGDGIPEFLWTIPPDLKDFLWGYIESVQWIRTRRHFLDPEYEFVNRSRTRVVERIKQECALKTSQAHSTV